MDNLVLEYDDPLFGIIAFFLFIFIISFLTYSFSVYKEKRARREYRKLLKRFELGKLKEDDYVHLYKTYNLPFDSIILLSSTFLHKGDYNKAISVYLALLEHVRDRVKKEELLELLGTTYFKGGFMQRSRDIFLKILKFSPRNKNALTHLLIIYERLKEYKNASEVIVSLDELQQNISKEKVYIDSLQTLNDPLLSFEKKREKIEKLYKDDQTIERLYAQFLLQFNKELFWKAINQFNVENLIDLLWYLNFDDIDFDTVSQNRFLNELYNAKGYLSTLEHSDDFAFDILMLLNRHEHKVHADLNFEFLCTSCKHKHPIFDTRCPHCHSILSFKVRHTLVKGMYEANQSLQ